MSAEAQAYNIQAIEQMDDSVQSEVRRIFDVLRAQPGIYRERLNAYVHAVNADRFPGGWNRNFYLSNKPSFQKVNIGPLVDKKIGEWQVIWYEPVKPVQIVAGPKAKSVATSITKEIAKDIKAKAMFLVKDRDNTFTMRTEPAYYEADLYNVLSALSKVEYTVGTARKKTLTATFIGKHTGKKSSKSAKVDERTRDLVADIGMLYYFADHAATQGYEVQIIDQRGQFTNKPIDVEAEANKLLVKEGKPPTFKFREYQRKAIEAALKRKNGILRLATGAGKTEIAMGIIGRIGGDALFVVPRKSLAVQTYKRLQKAGFKNLGILYGDVKDVSNTPHELDVNVVVKDTGHNYLEKFRKPLYEMDDHDLTDKQKIKLKELKQDPEKMKKYKDSYEKSKANFESMRKTFMDFVKQADVVVFDEAHHVKAETYSTFAQANPASFRYGLSATPFADDPLQTAQVREKLGDILYDLPASALIAHEDGNRYLSTPVFKMIPFAHDPNIEKIVQRMKAETYIYLGGKEKGKNHPHYGAVVNSWTGETSDGMRFGARRYPCFLKHFINQNERRNKLIAVLATEFTRRKMPSIIVVESIDHGVRIKMALDEAGVRSEMVASGEDPGEDEGLEEDEMNENQAARITIVTKTDDREAVFQKLKTGELDVMIGTSGLIGEGLDIPDLMAAIIAQGGKSFTRAYQRAGRVMRLHGNEKGFRASHSLIVEIFDCLTDERINKGVLESSNIIDPMPILKGVRGIKYFAEHFERRIQLYKVEKEFVLSWARSIKDVFSVDFMNADGTTVTKDPWTKANDASKQTSVTRTGTTADKHPYTLRARAEYLSKAKAVTLVDPDKAFTKTKAKAIMVDNVPNVEWKLAGMKETANQRVFTFTPKNTSHETAVRDKPMQKGKANRKPSKPIIRGKKK